MNRYATIVADPPWPYNHAKAMPIRNDLTNHGTPEGHGSSVMQYGAMSMLDLLRLRVGAHAARNSHLYLWFTNAFAKEAHQLATQWGFTPKTILTWVKVKPDGTPSMKMGYYFRGATEHVLFCVRGKLRLHAERALPTAYLWPRTPHSVKPDAFYELVEEASPGPYLEMFARRKREGWACWGNELENDVDLDPASYPVCGKRNAVPMRCKHCGTNGDHYCPSDIGTE